MAKKMKPAMVPVARVSSKYYTELCDLRRTQHLPLSKKSPPTKKKAKKAQKKKLVTVYLSSEEYKWLRKISKDASCSMSEQIRRWLGIVIKMYEDSHMNG